MVAKLILAFYPPAVFSSDLADAFTILAYYETWIPWPPLLGTI